jgi:hypothetical protein
MGNIDFAKTDLPVRRMLLLFGVEEPTMVCHAKINLFFKVTVKVNHIRARICSVFAPIV